MSKWLDKLVEWWHSPKKERLEENTKAYVDKYWGIDDELWDELSEELHEMWKEIYRDECLRREGKIY